MRTLSSALLAAQKAAIGTPVVDVVVRPRLAAATRLKWTNLYRGSEQQYLHAAATPEDGSLIRARIENVSGTRTICRHRAPAPGLESSWTPWTLIEICSYAGVGMASSGARVIIFWAQPDQKTIRYIESLDNGATWSAIQTLYTTTNAIYHPAAAMKPNGDVCLFYFEWNTIYAVKRVSGTWGGPAAYPYAPDIVSGLAASYKSHTRSGTTWDWNVVVTGRNTGNQRGVWTFLYGTAAGSDAWTEPRAIQIADYTGIDYRSPFLCIDGAIHRLTFTEASSSGQNYERVFMTWQVPQAEDVDTPGPATFIENLWHEPYPFHPGSYYAHFDNLYYGMAIVANADHAYLTAPDAVWQAPTTPPAIPLTARVLSLKQTINPIQAGGSQVTLEVENADLALTPHTVESVWTDPIEADQELEISPGYRTAEGDEVSAGPSHWITRVRITSSPSRCTAIITAAGPEYLLEGTAIRWQKTWNADEATILEILTWILSRAGIPLYVEASSTFATAFKPAFKISAGQDCLTALRRVLALTGDVLHFRRATALLTTPNDASTEEYHCPGQPGKHPLYQGGYDQTPLPINWINAWGTLTPLTTADEVLLQVNDQYGRLETFSDLNLDNQADATDRARARLTQRYRLKNCGQIVIPPHCGLELWDMMKVVDQRAGIEREWRAMSIEFTYAREKKSLYHMTVNLCPQDDLYPRSEPG